MTPIQLTEEHKSKLLEMCKALFPEMDAHTVKDVEDSNGMILGTWGQSTNGIAIHWFEFCMTYLIQKISQINPKTDHDYEHLIEGLFINTNEKHPVDFLYEEFKKLK